VATQGHMALAQWCNRVVRHFLTHARYLRAGRRVFLCFNYSNCSHFGRDAEVARRVV